MSCIGYFNNDLKKGATLLEILISVSIIIVLTSLSLANFRGVRATNELRDATEQVKNAIIETHALALSPRNIDPDPSRADEGISQYTFQFNFPSSRRYQIQEGYSTLNAPSVNPQVVRIYQLPDRISFQAVSNFLAGQPSQITFSVTQQANIIQGLIANTACIEVKSARTDISRWIKIERPTKIVSIQDSNQGC
jgi:Tfp pilus assembly protein FimT